jgi:rhodanese-related sulfurtransferase
MSPTDALGLLGKVRCMQRSWKRAVLLAFAWLTENVRPGGVLYELAAATGKRLVFYCAFGERSAMAVQAARDAGIESSCHIQGGLGA